ncbi:PaaI family thioesterase [Sphingobium sp. HBC34]|uniref:PaaI family thioesterase n=1 Tax=Sphingobium cyanobacteriorum TaxID=3063954 RepID=A0ABT8ZP84_9SPHN|nr:PaaI family thioesterase [Sphingobium sp. HBC34]MDO7836330.1 PaaI family thioesterase [Sphingobium sp. HBC34]
MRKMMARPHIRVLFGMDMVDYQVGKVTLGIDHRPELGHAPGWFQGTVTSALAECAAALSGVTVAVDKDTMTLQQSIYFTGPARGTRLIAEGRVVTQGRRISTTAADIFVLRDDERHLCATMTMTVIHTELKR